MYIKHQIQLFLLFILLLIRCKNYSPIIYQFKTVEYEKHFDTISNYLLLQNRIKYSKVNDSTIAYISIADSIKLRDSNTFTSFRDTKTCEKAQILRHLSDSIFKALDFNIFYDTTICNKTRILLINPTEGNDTLKFEKKRKFHDPNVYSFYHRYHGNDDAYRLFICDSVGVIAYYSGSWNMLTILDKVNNNETLNNRWQIVKNDLIADSIFFPNTINTELKAKYIPPIE